MVIRENGDVEYALKIPVEDLAEALGRQDHAALNAPEVRGAEELLFRHFQPLVGMTSAGAPCPVERSGIDVPEDERLYGELRFVFHCPAGAPVTLDYRVFFDIDPGHMGMLEVESPGGKTRAELIRERPRWEVQTPADGPPQVRAVESTAGADRGKQTRRPRELDRRRARQKCRRSPPRREAGRAPSLERRRAREDGTPHARQLDTHRARPCRRYSGRLPRAASGAAPPLTSFALTRLRQRSVSRWQRKRPAGRPSHAASLLSSISRDWGFERRCGQCSERARGRVADLMSRLIVLRLKCACTGFRVHRTKRPVVNMQHLTKYFDRTYVINLPSRPDRLREMKQELARWGVGLGSGKVELFPAIRPADPGDFPSLGARGCFTSHLEILRRALSRGSWNVLIMEDDLVIDSQLAAIEEKLVQTLSSTPWSLVYLGHRAPHVARSADDFVRSEEETTCAHFYGVSAQALPALVEFLETVLKRPAGHPDGGPMHYDGALTWFRAQNPRMTLFASPSLGWQRSSRSDIAPPKWFDRVPLVRDAVSRTRRLRNVAASSLRDQP